jgi:cytoskeletal protein CcmA (bactofilin family)
MVAESAQTPLGQSPLPAADLRPIRPTSPARPAEERAAEAPRLREMLIGDQVHIKGTTTKCDLLSVSGHVELSQAECEVLEIAPSGVFDGSARVVRGEIKGTFRGKLQIRSLTVRSSATIDAELEYGELEIERGAKVSGTLRATR